MELDSADDMCVAVAAECIQELHLSLHFALSAPTTTPSDLSSPLRVRWPYAGPTNQTEHVWVQQLYNIMSGKFGVEF